MHHPECSPNETWVGNTEGHSDVPAHLSPLTTARLGQQAYDIHGKPLSPERYRPLIIGRSEGGMYDRIMTERTFG